MTILGAAKQLTDDFRERTFRTSISCKETVSLTTMTSPIKATWHPITTSEALKRSSQTLFTTRDDLIVFSGELQPRQPVDNKIYHVPLVTSNPETKGQVTMMNPSGAPSPRVGAASTVLGGKAYLFSGRGGEAMAPLEENGALWVYDQGTLRWSKIEPADSSAEYPEGRSYHAMTSDGHDKIYLHAGCPASGRLADLWSFSISEKNWKKLANAPPPARGGASIAFLSGKLYRANGFDGKTEQGFALDVYDSERESWSTKTWSAETGPSPRSVCTLLPIKIVGKEYLVTMFGESDPSNAGHMGAGKMLDDVWAHDVQGERWRKVETEVKGGERGPAPRGWFAAAAIPGRGNKVVVQGGLGEDNERLGDVWVLECV